MLNFDPARPVAFLNATDTRGSCDLWSSVSAWWLGGVDSAIANSRSRSNDVEAMRVLVRKKVDIRHIYAVTF
jgi:hypothetical protein